MKVKVLKDFVLFDGKYFRIQSEVELDDKLAKDLIGGEYVIKIPSKEEEIKIPKRKKKKEGEE